MGSHPNSDDAIKHYITGAMKILKDSTKGGSVAKAGAVFSVDGDLLADDFEVIDNGANDGDPAIGVICVGGVTPGRTTRQRGHGAARLRRRHETACHRRRQFRHL